MLHIKIQNVSRHARGTFLFFEVVEGLANTCDYRFKSDSLTPSSSFCLATSRCAARRLSYPQSWLGDLFVSSPYPKHYFKRSVHTPRRAEEQEAAVEEDEDRGEGCFAGGKIFLTAFASPPTSDFSHSSLRSLPPFRGTFSTDACAFPDFISLGKIIVALARAPHGSATCVRASTRVRDLYVRPRIYTSVLCTYT